MHHLTSPYIMVCTHMKLCEIFFAQCFHQYVLGNLLIVNIIWICILYNFVKILSNQISNWVPLTSNIYCSQCFTRHTYIKDLLTKFSYITKIKTITGGCTQTTGISYIRFQNIKKIKLNLDIWVQSSGLILSSSNLNLWCQ